MDERLGWVAWKEGGGGRVDVSGVKDCQSWYGGGFEGGGFAAGV